MKQGTLRTITLVFALILAISFNSYAKADIITSLVNKPDVSSTLYQVAKDECVDPTNSFNDGGAKYYLLTQDINKQGLTSIDFDGTSYPLEQVYLVTPTTSLQSGVPGLFPAYKAIANKTIFIDSGTYNDDTQYTTMSSVNLSLVGLSNSDKPVLLRKSFGTYTDYIGWNTSTQEYADRHLFTTSDIYLRNIVFDGNNLNLRNNQGTYKSRGHASFVINGSEGANNFVMKDCDIVKIGSRNDLYYGYNAALNILYGSNQINLEGLNVNNTKTNSVGVIYTNTQKNVYIKDLKLDTSLISSSSWGLRVENTLTTYVPLNENSVVLSGNNQLTNGFFQVQDYRYDKIQAPMEFRYVEYYRTNGNTNTGTYRVHNSLSTAPNVNSAKLDRLDNYWIVDESLSGTSVEQQIKTIFDTIEYMRKITNMPAERIPSLNIKLLAKDNEINNFDIPNNITENINIVAVNTLDKSVNELSTLVPVQAGFKANFKNTSSANLFNFDFFANAKYTAEEVVFGYGPATITDAKDTAYPSNLNYADYGVSVQAPPAITLDTSVQPSMANYQNCKFVVLVKEISASEKDGKTQIPLNTTASVKVDITGTFVSRALLGTPDDPSMYFESSDTAIATIDQTGAIVPISMGNFKVYVKAKDSFNNGEVEKPYAVLSFEVVAPLIKPTEKSPIIPAPQTGDISNTVLYTIIAIISLLVIVLLIKKANDKKRK